MINSVIVQGNEEETPGGKRQLSGGGLPDLTGTPEEIAQADPIRTEILVAADDVLTDLRSNQILTEEQKDTAIRAERQVNELQVHEAQVALNRLRRQTEASWWIAHKGADARQLLEEMRG